MNYHLPHQGPFQEILRHQINALLVFVVLTVAAILIGAGVQGLQHNTQRHEVAAAQNRAHFWRVIAGEEVPNTPTVDNALAQDLKERLGPIDRNTTELPDEIKHFRGSSNSYGGITDAIGRDPFDNQGLPCQECGPLDRSTQKNLLEIKRGYVDRVVRSDTPILDATYTVTPYGLPTWQFGLFWWIAVGGLSLTWGVGRARIKRAIDLDWRITEGDESNAKLAIHVISLPTIIVYRLDVRHRRRKLEHQLREQYPDCAALIDDVDHMLDRVSLRYGDDDRVAAVQAARDELQRELESLTRSKNAGDIDILVKSMESRVEAVRESLTSRQEALKELENS